MNFFLDCGSNLGQAYVYFKEKYGLFYKFLLFEPNPNCYAKLIEKFGKLPDIKIYNQAIYSQDCSKIFRFSEKYSVGGSIIDYHNSLYKSKKNNEVLVRCVDIVKIIEDLHCDELVIKLDIESSEYDVLERMINSKIIFGVKKIYCEFHSQYMNSRDKEIFKPRENKIMKFVHDNNIDFEIWK